MNHIPTQTFQPGASSVPTSKVEVSVSCRNLADKDVLSKSDPLVVLFVKEFGSHMFREYGRTETVMNTLNPNFVKKFTVDYFFEESQKLQFDVYDSDSRSADLNQHDFLGTADCTLGELVSVGSLQRNLKGRGGSPGKGSIILRAEELLACKEEVTMQWCGKKLDKKDFFGKSDPFLIFYRTNEDNAFTVVYKTDVIKNTLNPTWKPFTLPLQTLSNGDYDRPIRVECYDWNKSGSHELIGIFTTSAKEISQGPGSQNSYECIDPKKKQSKGSKYHHSGMIELLSSRIEAAPSFIDFIIGGCQLHCTFVIDFTASNGDPRQPSSLHFNNPYKPNYYQMAIRSVGDIIQDYDSDKLFPALGFGARMPPDGRISHEFFLNGDRANPYCQGVDGVLQAYSHTLNSVQLYGPTNFSPCINHVASLARQHADGNNYFILLILTDGAITDMAQTCESIVNASSLPLSIIIVGVGNADFEAMNILDGDNVRLSSKGRLAERDIVQFVPFNDFLDRNSDVVLSQARLAKEVLAEIPDQFLSYMKSKGYKPKPPVLQRHGSIASAPPM